MSKLRKNSTCGRVALTLLLIIMTFGGISLQAQTIGSVEEALNDPRASYNHTPDPNMDSTDYPAPVADFYAYPTEGCDSVTVMFIDLSTGIINEWLWEFGDGATSTKENPTHFYARPGTYTVTLTVTGPGGTDIKTRVDHIVVKNAGKIDFDYKIEQNCEFTKVKFEDLSSNVWSWEWDFGDGTTSTEQNPTHIYTISGTFLVTLKVTGECGPKYMHKVLMIAIDRPPVVGFYATPTEACVGDVIAFTNLSQYATSFYWEFGDGTTSTEENPTHIYNTPGVYTVTLTGSNACGKKVKSRSEYITIHPRAIADFEADKTELCLGSDVSFTDLSINAETWLWDFGDGTTSTDQNPTHTYTARGFYTVSLTVTNICGPDTRTRELYIRVFDEPIADFEADPTETCTETTIQFTDLSIDAATWSWDFGDGDTSSDPNPTHSYSIPGLYTIILTVTNDCGRDSETKTEYISVSYPPIADFEADPTETCTGTDIQFTDLSQYADSVLWDFGDGTTSRVNNPTHSYTNRGLYTITLTVYNGCGSDTETKTEYISIEQKPIADFVADPTNTCIGVDIQFTDLSQYADSVLWDFGDGTTSTTNNPTHSYSSVGYYTIKLTAYNECGTDTETKTEYITVNDEPIADFEADPTETCTGVIVQFTNFSQYADSVLWDFGDGATSRTFSPTHTYSLAGTYTIILTVYNTCGTDSETKTEYITVDNSAIADFDADPTETCTGEIIQFTDLSQYADSVLWDFGDGNTSTEQNPTHSYYYAGSYTVTLTAYNECGPDSEKKIDYITINSGPIADFGANPTGICVGEDVQFSNYSYFVDSVLWNFGDGTTSKDANPLHTYTSAGLFTVTLTAYNECGTDKETKVDYIGVSNPPTPDFEADPTETCTGVVVRFTNLSQYADFSTWDFGDGTTLDAHSPTHTYTQAGTYTVSLTVSNPCGDSTETKIEYINVKNSPIADFEADPTETCIGTDIQFTDHSQYADSLLWNFGDGTTSKDINPTHSYSNAGRYTVTLTAYNECGPDSETKTNYITIKGGPTAEFSADPTKACIETDIQFTDHSQDADSVLWDFGDGNTSKVSNPTHSYSNAGSYTIILTAYNECGTDSETKTDYITVSDGPTADFSGSPTSGNAPLTVNFADLSTSTLGIDTRSWDFGDGGSSNEQDPQHTYNSPGIYTVELIVTDACGADTARKVEYIYVIDTCIVDFFAEPTEGCAPLTVYFNGTSEGDCDISFWSWDFGDPSSGNDNTATGQIVTHEYNESGTYTIILKAVDDGDTIVVEKKEFITVYGPPTAAFDADPASGVAPLTVNFTDRSTTETTIRSWSWDFGDGYTSQIQNPSHQFLSDGIYTVVLEITDDCGVDSAEIDIIVDPDITITKQVDKTSAEAGEELLYTLLVKNNGREAINNIIVFDTIPDTSSYIQGSITGTGGYYDQAYDIVAWNIQSIGPGAEITLTFEVLLDGPFDQFPVIVSNQAFATINDEIDKVFEPAERTFASNIVYTTIGPTTGIIGITKEVSTNLASPGDELTYTITVNNDGTLSQALDVVIYDAIPDSTTYVSGSITGGGTYNNTNDSLVWSLGNLNAGETRSVTFAVTVDTDIPDGSTIPNTALVQTSNMGGNESNRVTTIVSLQPLVIRKSVNRPSAMFGDLARYMITVENYTTAPFTDVQVIDTMPNGILYINGTSLLNSVATNDPSGSNPLIWSLGDLPAGGTLILEYAASVGTSVKPGLNENVAYAEALQGGVPVYSNRAFARINIIGTTLSGSIRGKVVVDCDGDGIADMEYAPVGTDVYLDDGSQSKVNKEGMFYFSTVRPGERVVMLDERDLDGYYIPEGAQASVFAHVHEKGESYIIFRICPEYPLLDITKKASIIPMVKVVKSAQINPAPQINGNGLVLDYNIDVKSNGLAEPTKVRIVDTYPDSTDVAFNDDLPVEINKDGNQFVYEFMVADDIYQESIEYTQTDMSPGYREFLTNQVYLEGDIDKIDEKPTTITSEPAEVAVGPLYLAPPKDVSITLTPALFITSKAFLQEPAIPLLHAVADSIDKYSDADIKVEGHTDYRPIHTKRFPSNWELGEARARSVVDWLVDNRGIDRERLDYESFAATRPVVTTGKTSEELQPNRRTEVIIKSKMDGFIAPAVIPADNWQKSTILELTPVRFDTLFESAELPVDIEFTDSWEVIINIENGSHIAAENILITDVLPDGVEYIENSMTLDGESIIASIENNILSLNLDKIDPKQKLELRYRIRNVSDTPPTGGGPATVTINTADNRLIDQKSNEVLAE